MNVNSGDRADSDRILHTLFQEAGFMDDGRGKSPGEMERARSHICKLLTAIMACMYIEELRRKKTVFLPSGKKTEGGHGDTHL